MLVATLASPCVGSPGARAQESQDIAAYTSIIDSAIVEFGQGHWEEAYALFRRAHELNPSARTWRGLGISAFELRRYVEAIADLEASLVDPRKPLTPEQREQVKRVIQRAREFVSVYRVRIKPDSAEVIVDGKPAALKEGQLHLDPGPHTIVVRASGYEEHRTELRAGAGNEEELSLELSLMGDDEQTIEKRAAADTSPIRSERTTRRRRVWTWTLAGASVAAAAVATGLRLRVNGVADEYGYCIQDSASCNQIKSRGERFLNASYGTAAVAGALFAGAVVAFFVESEKRAPTERNTVSVSISPLGLYVAGGL
jgi:hypothetical protein